jgi:asparagine synthase (glutamine-hydrolysing)
MCGITGIYHLDSERIVDPKKLQRMTDLLIHRGPDGEGFYIDKNIGLGHRRLSIIDLETGAQPMVNEERKTTIVFNGEIYNYIEIRDILISLGYFFKTKSDTEVVLKAYEEWGYNCLEKFNGMWAFAIWDSLKQELFLSRDRVGEKPLFFSEFNNTFVFASEIKSILAFGVPPEKDLDLLEIYLSLTVIPAPYTFYKKIHKLEPGSYLVVNNKQVKQVKYWDLPLIDEKNMLTDKNFINNKFTELFHDSVRLRMRCDVPFGGFLSGGLDSSSIVSVMQQYSAYPIETFTIGFDNPSYDERPFARLVAKKFNTNHHEIFVEPLSIQFLLDTIIGQFDEPFGDSSAIPTAVVSEFASKNVKMVLTGDGGDELLSGYNTYQKIKLSNLAKKIPHPIISILHFLSNPDLFPKSILNESRTKFHEYTKTFSLDFNSQIIYNRIYPNIFKQLKESLLSSSSMIHVEDYIVDLMNKCTFRDDFYKLMYINYKFDLPNDYLVKVDRMSMLYSIETRTPFLDFRLIEFMAGVDKLVKMKNFQTKSILRNTIAKNLPPQLLRGKKKGFAVPINEYFNKDIQFSKKMVSNKYLNDSFVGNIISHGKKININSGSLFWTLASLKKFI